MSQSVSMEFLAEKLNAPRPRRSAAHLPKVPYPAQHGRLPRRPAAATTADRPLDAYALDPRAGVFHLRIRHDGHAVLSLNQEVVTSLASSTGSAILKNVCCPFERAADIVAAIDKRFPVSARTRAEFEFKVARWIPEYFDL